MFIIDLLFLCVGHEKSYSSNIFFVCLSMSGNAMLSKIKCKANVRAINSEVWLGKGKANGNRLEFCKGKSFWIRTG